MSALLKQRCLQSQQGGSFLLRDLRFPVWSRWPQCLSGWPPLRVGNGQDCGVCILTRGHHQIPAPVNSWRANWVEWPGCADQTSVLCQCRWCGSRHGRYSLEADVLREQAMGRPELSSRLIYSHIKPTASENIRKAWTWRILGPWLWLSL